MTEVTDLASQRLAAALGDQAGQLTVHTRACHLENGPLTKATAMATVRRATWQADLNAAHRALAGMPGLVFLTLNGPEIWLYLNTVASA